jgi:hypothetical protein
MNMPFQTQQESAPGFRPRCKISAASDGGGLGGGMLEMAASLLGAPQDDPWANHLRALDLTLAPAPYLSTARLQLAYGAQSPEVALEDAFKLALGYEDNLQGVFSGQVLMRRDNGRDVQELLLGCGGHALARLRQYVSFENQSLGDVLGQWAGEASLASGSIDAGPSYAFLAIDDRRSLWEWSALLAAQAGSWVWMDADNQLNCKQPGEPGGRSYAYGTDLLRLDFAERIGLFGEVRVQGEGSAGSQGAQAWGWLTKSPDGIGAGAGQGDPRRLYQAGALRNQAAVQAYGQALDNGARRLRQTVKVRVPGSAELGLGQTFELTDCPAGRGDGSYIITRLRHRYDSRGFITELTGVAA